MTPEQREELKQAAMKADQDGQHIYTNPRDSNNWRNNDAFNAAASPAVVLSLIAQVEALTVPQGWKLVPIEPTPAMLERARNAPLPMVLIDSISGRESLRIRSEYGAMLDAAPTIPATPGTKEGA